MLPTQLNATSNGKILPPVSPKTRRKKRAATNCPEFRISSRGTAATYATLVKRKRRHTANKEINPALVEYLVGVLRSTRVKAFEKKTYLSNDTDRI